MPRRHVLLPLSLSMLGAVGVTGLLVAGMSSNLFGRAPPAAGEVMAEPAQVAVVDADTLRLGARVVRLAGIDAPERGVSCRDGAGREFDCGVAAANALAALVRDAPVDCQLHGTDGMGRAMAVCEARGKELNRALVEAGWARAAASEPRFAEAADAARAGGLGLWAGGRNGW